MGSNDDDSLKHLGCHSHSLHSMVACESARDLWPAYRHSLMMRAIALALSCNEFELTGALSAEGAGVEGVEGVSGAAAGAAGPPVVLLPVILLPVSFFPIILL